MEKLNIAIICGGVSVESDISIITGVQIYNLLQNEKYNKCLIYIDGNGQWWKCPIVSSPTQVKSCKKQQVVLVQGDSHIYELKSKKMRKGEHIHCVLLALHGGMGENGGVQALLSMSNIPHTASGNISSGLTMDKCYAKCLQKYSHFNILPFFILQKNDYFNDYKTQISNISHKLKFPIIVKPSCLGSSIGISVATNENELKQSLELAFKYDNKIIAEHALQDFTELNISAYIENGVVKCSEIERPFKKNQILSFDDKYNNGAKSKVKFAGKGMSSLKREFPAQISDELREEVNNTTKEYYKLFNCFGIVRFDYLLSNNNKLYLNEINSIPGSLSYYLWDDFNKVLDAVITQSIKRYLQEKDLIKNYDYLK